MYMNAANRFKYAPPKKGNSRNPVMTSGYVTRNTEVSPNRKLIRYHSTSNTTADTSEPTIEALFTTVAISSCSNAIPRMTPPAKASDPTHRALRQ